MNRSGAGWLSNQICKSGLLGLLLLSATASSSRATAQESDEQEAAALLRFYPQTVTGPVSSFETFPSRLWLFKRTQDDSSPVEIGFDHPGGPGGARLLVPQSTQSYWQKYLPQERPDKFTVTAEDRPFFMHLHSFARKPGRVVLLEADAHPQQPMVAQQAQGQDQWQLAVRGKNNLHTVGLLEPKMIQTYSRNGIPDVHRMPLPDAYLALIDKRFAAGWELLSVGLEGLAFHKGNQFQLWLRERGNPDAPLKPRSAQAKDRIVPRPPDWVLQISNSAKVSNDAEANRRLYASLAVCSPATWRHHRDYGGFLVDPEIWWLKP